MASCASRRLRNPATSVRQALAAAVAWELIDENPAKKAGRNPQPKAREIRPLTVEELGCGHLSGIHDHACKARGCRCEKFERFASFPVPYVLRHTFASNGACRGRRDVPARKGHGNLA